MDAKPVAGGTALLTIIKQGLLLPKSLVNLKKIRDGAAISFDPHRGMRIGALATINEIETSPLVRSHYPAFAEACHVALQPGELITAISIPPLPQGFKGIYIKFTTGSSEERPCAGIAALARMENGTCRELRLAVGAVSTRPARITAGRGRFRADRRRNNHGSCGGRR